MRRELLAALSVFAFLAPAHAQDAQPDPYHSREVAPGPFDRIEVSGPFMVSVLVGEEARQVRFIGPPALLADTIATVEGDTLQNRFREGATWSWNPGSGVNVLVSAPHLVSAGVHGAATLEINQVRGEAFSAATDGSGSIALRGLDAGRVALATSGAGGITAEGRAREATYATGMAGSIDAKRLRVRTASIAVGGSGSIYADVSTSATVSLAGTGRVDVVGGAKCAIQPGSAPRVECR